MTTAISLSDVQDLYEQNRFVDAYRQTAPYWNGSRGLADLSSEELVLGARLAARLGGGRLCRWLLRMAIKKSPADAQVLYYSWHVQRRRQRLFEELRLWEAKPELDGADAVTQSSWLASQAIVWASLRDFGNARRCILRAHSVHPKDSWVLSCESAVLGFQDRWQEALACSELACEIRPGTPYGLGSLAHCLLNLRRLDEAAHRLSSEAEHCQSFEIAQLTCWYLCALAETEEGDERRRTLTDAKALCGRFEELAPLADRESRPLLARARLDVAALEDDHQAMDHWATEARSPFHQAVLKNLRKNPGGRRMHLPFRRAIQRHDTCLPTSIASALGANGISIDAEAMAAELTFGGTPEWAAAEWLEKRGMAVKFFCVTAKVAVKLIQNGIAFVLTLEADANAHAVAAVGLDESAGTLIIHDPQSLRTTEYLLDFFDRGEAPLGPRGIVMVPHEKARLVDTLLPPEDVEAMSAREAHQRAIVTESPLAAKKIVEKLKQKQPTHPQTRLLEAMQALAEGRVGVALARFQELFHAFPNSVFVRARILESCRLVGNTALMRKTLAGVVERGMLPGIQSQQDWVHTPGVYTSEYAALLGMSEAGKAEARSLLHEAISRENGCPQAWHALGDLLWRERDLSGASLAYRIASSLAEGNEHYSRAYCEALGASGHAEEGLAWLQERARRLGTSAFGVVTWVTWIAAQEDWGYPERALAAADEALGMHGNSPDLLGFVVPFTARMGQWDRAEILLKKLEASGNTVQFHEAAADFYRMRGELEKAIEHAEKWVSESPHYVRARRELLSLLVKRDSAFVALKHSLRWLSEHPAHDELEQAHCDMLDRVAFRTGEKYRLLLRRLKRNPEDAWAWREIAFLSIGAYRQTAAAQQKRIAKRVERFLAESERTAPGDTATLRVRAEWDEANGRWLQALEGWVESSVREPDSGYGYLQILELLPRLSPERRQSAWKRMEQLLSSYRSRLTAARNIVMRAGTSMSVATVEESLSYWRRLRPDDPELVEATADLLLEHGQGRTDAQRALQMLETAAERFPYHAGLRFSLADALRRLGETSEAQAVLVEILRRHPDASAAHVQLARLREHAGQTAEALSGLQAAAAHDPQNADLWDVRAQILLGAGRTQEARQVVDEGMLRFPRNVHWRERALRLFLQCGDDERAIQAAREGVRIYPRGAYLWFLLGQVLSQKEQFSGSGEIEACFRRGLALNQGLFAAADLLAIHLTEQRRYGEAEQVMAQIQDRLSDPAPARGRIAWIHRQQGRKAEARRELATLVREVPWYEWGWALLMEWLEEDKDRDETLRVLADVPRELATNVRFRRQRLITLEKATITVAEQDAEWNSLLRDFPEDVALHLHRYDSLRDAKRAVEAEEVLQRILPLDPESPYVLARRFEVLAKDANKKEEAATAALQIFFSSGEQSTWPATFAWATAKKHHLEGEIYVRACMRMEKGSVPTPLAVALLAAHGLVREGTEKKTLQPRWRAWFPDAGAREVLRMLRLIDASPQGNDVHRANLLRELDNVGYHRLVVRHWKMHRAEVELGTQTWAETGRALIGLKKYSAVRKLLGGWRGRSGVPMWAITNYLLSLNALGSKEWREIFATCRDALAGLSHDHCAKYLAHRQAEAALLLGEEEAFLETCNNRQNYFDAKLTQPEWFEARRKYLLTDVPVMARALASKDLRTYKQMRRSILWKQVSFKLPRLKVNFSDSKVSYRWLWPLFWLFWILARMLASR